MAEEARELVQRFVDFVEAGHVEDAFRLLNPNGRFIVTGQTRASGVYEALDDIFSRLTPKLSGFTVLPKIQFADVIVDGDKAFSHLAAVLRLLSQGGRQWVRRDH